MSNSFAGRVFIGRLFISLGALNAFISVAMGAFAAHALKHSLAERYLSAIQTAADYQFYHALGLILIGILYQQNRDRLTALSGWFMLCGILFFSGSLYVLGLSGTKWLGMITPAGGLCLMIAWLILAFAHLRPDHHH
ncbi:MAG: DUF423 domain-containing protein [Gammaproteobacteria bacterium]|nr:DUF423 domain-containing protein [Gammaproteobacteria bacterium]